MGRWYLQCIPQSANYHSNLSCYNSFACTYAGESLKGRSRAVVGLEIPEYEGPIPDEQPSQHK